MSRITLNEGLRALLNGLDRQLEVCDETGRVVGVFLPAEDYKKYLRAYDQCPYSEEELERFHQESGERPLAEIWKDLGQA